MITDNEFILAIKLYPELYQIYKDGGIDAEAKNKELWSQFARDNQYKNGATAELKWRQIISKYVSFLMYGTPFPFEREMQFMQMPLLGVGLEDTQFDSDIDETELRQVLNLFEEFPTDVKKQHMTSAIDRETSKKLAQTKMQGNKLTSKQNGLNTAKTENVSTAITATTHAKAVTKSSEDGGASGGFSNLTSLELIFLGYAKVLQRMPLRLQLQTKRKIADIMDEAELKLFEGN